MSEDELDQKIIGNVDEIGWSIMSVAPAKDSDDPEEWWSYTIGLPKTFNWPEIAIFGLSSSLSKDLLNDLVKFCCDNDQPPIAGAHYNEIIKNLPVKLIDGSHIPNSYLGYAQWFARHNNEPSPVNKLQLIWPDKSGYFPDQASCNDDIRRLQTPVETNE